jgi:hypothetical protein
MEAAATSLQQRKERCRIELDVCSAQGWALSKVAARRDEKSMDFAAQNLVQIELNCVLFACQQADAAKKGRLQRRTAASRCSGRAPSLRSEAAEHGELLADVMDSASATSIAHGKYVSVMLPWKPCHSLDASQSRTCPVVLWLMCFHFLIDLSLMCPKERAHHQFDGGMLS